MNEQLKEIESKTVETYWAEICMAGDLAVAKQAIRQECFWNGLCVTVTPTDFIYTGGEETGFIVRLINYSRFPSTPKDIYARAESLARILMGTCCQLTATIICPDKTEWLCRRKDK